jgi:hypothetical protein
MTSALMMEAEIVSETLHYDAILTWLITQEGLILNDTVEKAH